MFYKYFFPCSISLRHKHTDARPVYPLILKSNRQNPKTLPNYAPRTTAADEAMICLMLSAPPKKRSPSPPALTVQIFGWIIAFLPTERHETPTNLKRNVTHLLPSNHSPGIIITIAHALLQLDREGRLSVLGLKVIFRRSTIQTCSHTHTRPNASIISMEEDRESDPSLMRTTWR